MEHKSKVDDDMEFEKVDDEMGCDKIDDDVEYVKVEKRDADVAYKEEKVDTDMAYKEKVGADMEHAHKVDADMAYKKEGVDADIDCEEQRADAEMEYEHKVDADMAYKEEGVDADIDCEEEGEGVDADIEYEHRVDADMAFKEEKVDFATDSEEERMDADMEHEKEDDINVRPPSSPYMRRRGEMDLEDVVKEAVLPLLPAKSLFKFRCISKEWDRWIQNPLFAHHQSYCFEELSGYFCQYGSARPAFVSLHNRAYGVPCQNFSFLPEEVNIITSCRGLLLCRGLDVLDPYYVCNPATKKWSQLPPPALYHGDEPSVVLAFEPSGLNFGAHYQILCAVFTFDHVLFELYSSETGLWRMSQAIVVETEYSRIKGTGFYMKGVAYMETSSRNVIAFHLSTEVYEVIPLPQEAPREGILTQVEGEVGYIGISRSKNNDYTVMIYAGMGMGLRRQIDLKIGPDSLSDWPDSLSDYRVLPCLDGSKNVMILVGAVIYLCSSADQSVKAVGRHQYYAMPDSTKKYLPYVNSLVDVASVGDSLW